MIQLDIDAGVSVPRLSRLTRLTRRAGYRVTALSQTRSPSGKGWHLVLTVQPRPSPLATVALQAILGSDKGREACNLYRVNRVMTGQVSAWWARRWNVLYRTTGRYGQ